MSLKDSMQKVAQQYVKYKHLPTVAICKSFLRRRRSLIFLGLLCSFCIFFLKFPRTNMFRLLYEQNLSSVIIIDKDVRLGCDYLNVKKLTRIEKSDRIPVFVEKKINNKSALIHGYYPYGVCPSPISKMTLLRNETLDRSRFPNLAFVTVVSMNYIETLFSWSMMVKSLGAVCAVVAIEAEVCEEVLRLSCKCIDLDLEKRKIKDEEGPHTSGWYKNRVLSVQKRFDGALHMLNMGFDVFMHDSDVFFKPVGMRLLVEYVYSVAENPSAATYDFMVQDNGRRDTAYDGLNWGFVWMNNTKNAKSTLSCVLDRWKDSAFGCKKCKDSYYERSQPRINHILEESIYAETAAKVSVCKYNTITSFNAKHMTGYPSVSKKITCARADGFLLDDDNFSFTKGRISYDVPTIAGIEDQRKALQAAAVLARSLSMRVEIPNVFLFGEPKQLCEVFDVKSLSSIVMKTSKQNKKCSAMMMTHIILDPINNTLTLLNSIKKYSEFSNMKGVGQQNDCVNFHWLLKLHSKFSKDEFDIYPIPICNPDNPVYRSIHSCKRDDDTDEV